MFHVRLCRAYQDTRSGLLCFRCQSVVLGMRGIVSLAAALSIPLSLPSGAEFPRNLLVFLTYVITLETLLIRATTLPWLMRWLGIKDGDEGRRDETVARLALFRAVLRELDLLKRSSALTCRKSTSNDSSMSLAPG